MRYFESRNPIQSFGFEIVGTYAFWASLLYNKGDLNSSIILTEQNQLLEIGVIRASGNLLAMIKLKLSLCIAVLTLDVRFVRER